LVRVTARTADILRRCYRGEIPADVLERAAVMLATADGHLDAGGRIKNGRRP
jgi:tellurite resistance protein